MIAPEGFPLVGPGDDLPALILDSLKNESIALEAGDVVVLAQKIVSKAEGRLVHLKDVTPSARAHELALKCEKDPRFVQLVLDESADIIRCVPGVLIVRHRLGMVMANAGIDQSNVVNSMAGEQVLLLPADPDASAARIRRELETSVGTRLAVIINDSFGRPWRMGTSGVCIGGSGIASIIDYRGDTDLFGQPLKVTQVALGDELAAAASILMGETSEARPLVIVRGLEYPVSPSAASHLLRPVDEDLFK